MYIFENEIPKNKTDRVLSYHLILQKEDENCKNMSPVELNQPFNYNLKKEEK